MKEIIEQMKDDILNGEELQYNYEIDGVSVTVLMDGFPWVRILAGGCEWKAHLYPDALEHYDLLSLEDTLAELAKFILYESIKSTIKDALKDNFRTKECADFSVIAFDYGTRIQIQYKGDKTVTVTVYKQDLVDDEDGILTKVAEFFVNY